MAKLSSKLSPKAKKCVLAGAASTGALVEVGAGFGAEETVQRLRDAGATQVSWVNKPRLLSIEIPSAGLPAVANLEEVVYVEAAETYSD